MSVKARTSFLALAVLGALLAAPLAHALRNHEIRVHNVGRGSGTVQFDALLQNTSCSLATASSCTKQFVVLPLLLVTLRASADDSSVFAGWTSGVDRELSPFGTVPIAGSCAGESDTSCTIRLGCATPESCALPVQGGIAFVQFDLKRYRLLVEKDGTGSGTVRSDPTGIVCGSDCRADVEHGRSVTLTASAGSGSHFAGWSGGGCAGRSTTCRVTMTEAETVTAVFARVPVATLPAKQRLALDGIKTLVVSRTGTGSGTVASTPAGINCGRDCSQAYKRGTAVVLTAAPAAGSTFAGWRECTPAPGAKNQRSCAVSMSEHRNVTATFALRTYALTVARQGEGRVLSSPAGIDCGSDCSQTYGHGTEVRLSAEPADGWFFFGWNGSGCSLLPAPCVVSMTQARSMTAVYARFPEKRGSR